MGSPRNEGEGNKTADRNYREATREFVESQRGQEEIKKAGNVSPEQDKEIRQAEEQAKQRARDHDPSELSDQESRQESRDADCTVRSSPPAH